MRGAFLVSIAVASLPVSLAGCATEPDSNNAGTNVALEAAPASNEVAPAENAQANASQPAGGEAILVNLERVDTVPETPNDSVMVSNPRFVSGVGGHFIVANVRYGGGCRPHEFRAYWNGSWNMSNPPGIGITLRHNANGDTCRALFNRIVQINISEPASANDRFWVELRGFGGSGGRVDVTIP